MPNWVYNSLTVTGPRADLDAFIEAVGKPYEVRYEDHATGEQKVEMRDTDGFSFWNIHAPDASIIDEYWSRATAGAPENNWYSWNNANWGTKWDAAEVRVERQSDEDWQVNFHTAWSPPYPVMETAAQRFPTLTFTLEWEEEQGFGAEAVFTYGDSREVRSWDIPSSHKDYIERDLECYCVIGEPEEHWFDDCPRPIRDHTRRFEEVSATL